MSMDYCSEFVSKRRMDHSSYDQMITCHRIDISLVSKVHPSMWETAYIQ